MTRTNMFATTVLVLGATLGVISATYASTVSPAEIIATRQANFKKIGEAMKVIKDQLAAGSIDKAKAVAAAQTIAGVGKMQKDLFPAGSGLSAGVKTDALPAIWAGKPAFDAQMVNFITEANKLVLAAQTGDADALGTQFKATGMACGACHKQFRADN